MANLVEKYRSWDDHQKNLFILIVIAVVGLLACVPFIFLDNIGVLLGWALGSVVNIIAFVTIWKGSASLLRQTDSNRGYLALIGAFLRIALYLGALLLSGFASFKWGTLAHGYCNIISLSLALMPTWIVVVTTTLLRANRAKPVVKEEPKPAEEEKKEGEE